MYHVGETFPRKDLLNDTFILKYYPDWTIKKEEFALYVWISLLSNIRYNVSVIILVLLYY